jgi:hypothetical protein
MSRQPFQSRISLAAICAMLAISCLTITIVAYMDNISMNPMQGPPSAKVRQSNKISKKKSSNTDLHIDLNSVAVLWGIIALFGVLISLLIQPADQAYTAYVMTVSQHAHDRAYSLSQAIKWIPMVVFSGILMLSMPLIVHAWRRRAFHAFWLIGGTLLAQLLFAGGVNRLAPDVPSTIPKLAHPDRCSTKLPHSVEAEHETTVRFRNDSTHRVEVIWLGYGGERVSYGVIRPGDALILPTWVTHPFVLTNPDDGNRCLAVVLPTDQVGVAAARAQRP